MPNNSEIPLEVNTTFTLFPIQKVIALYAVNTRVRFPQSIH